MDYAKLYDDLCKSRQQMKRSKRSGLYELHHIIPAFLFIDSKRKTRYNVYRVHTGTGDESSNLVLLTPREHFIAHLLLCEMYKGTELEHPMTMSLVFFTGKDGRFGNEIMTPKTYERLKHTVSKAQSVKMKGTFIAKCAKTGERVGFVSNTDSRVISGELVHISKGVLYTDERKAKRPRTNGRLNPNYKEMTLDRRKRVFSLIPAACRVINGEVQFVTNDFEKLLKHEFKEFKKVSIVWCKNNFGSVANMVTEYNTINNTKIIYKQYGKTKGTTKK